MNEPDAAAARERDLRILARHRISYVVVIGTAFAINVLTFSGKLWVFWPAFAWGLALLVHYCIVRSIHVEDAWVDERAEDLRMNSYDFDHIHTIQDRFERGSLDRAPSQKDGGR